MKSKWTPTSTLIISTRITHNHSPSILFTPPIFNQQTTSTAHSLLTLFSTETKITPRMATEPSQFTSPHQDSAPNQRRKQTPLLNNTHTILIQMDTITTELITIFIQILIMGLIQTVVALTLIIQLITTIRNIKALTLKIYSSYLKMRMSQISGSFR